MIQNWGDALVVALQDLLRGFVSIIPEIIGAIIILIVGWFIAIAIGKLVAEILKKIKFNQIFERGNWKEALSRAEIKVDPAGFVGAIAKWVLFIVFLVAAADVLGLSAFAGLLKGILSYIPRVITAVFIFVVTVIIVDIVDKLIRAFVEKAKVGYGHLVSIIVRYSIWVLAIIIIIQELKSIQVIETLFNTLLTGIVAFLVIAFGLAFGLGGKDVATDILQEWRRKAKE